MSIEYEGLHKFINGGKKTDNLSNDRFKFLPNEIPHDSASRKIRMRLKQTASMKYQIFNGTVAQFAASA